MPIHNLIPTGSSMQEREIPATGEKLPVVGLGTWLQFDVDSSGKERSDLLAVLRHMREKGGKLIDSSPMYGRSESVVGELTEATGFPDSYFYATKVWTTGLEHGIRQMNESFAKMRRKRMDLMQVHNLTDWQTHLKTLRGWKEEGKIRYTGVTHYTVSAHPLLERIVKSGAVDFVQFNYSIRVRDAEKRLLDTAREHRVAVIINEPFESGALFKAVSGRTLPGWAGDYGITSWAQFFLKFILSHPAVTCVIPGTSNPKHALDNMGAGYGAFPDAQARNKMAAFLDK